MGVGGIIEVVPALEEHVAGQEVDEQVAWLWVGYLRLVLEQEEHVAGEEVDEIAV